MSSYVRRKTAGDTEWFVHDRFGMFIHFGLYALPARHEWIKSRERISEEKYQKYFDHFNPDLFDAKEWARAAREAGIKYAVLTTKHHEGFCLFDTKYTDYKITNTKFGRDLVREYVEAFRAEGLKVGFYYSLIDWHHPDFTLDCNHPRRDDPDALQQNEGRDMRRYAKYMRDQVTELLTNYGKIDIIWFDYSYPDAKYEKCPWMKGKGKDDWEAEELIALVRKLQPHIIIDNRTGVECDLCTPEQYQVTKWPTHPETGELVTWEACQTFSGSWGYHRDEMTWKSPDLLIRMLVTTVACGGNLLMNVGPTSRGYFDKRALSALSVYGEWMKYHSRSIYGCTQAEPEFLENQPFGCRYTQSEDGERLYIHVFDYPFVLVEAKGLAGKVEYAQLLHDGSEVLFTEGDSMHFSEGKTVDPGTVFFRLPEVKPDVIVPVIEVFLKK